MLFGFIIFHLQARSHSLAALSTSTASSGRIERRRGNHVKSFHKVWYFSQIVVFILLFFTSLSSVTSVPQSLLDFLHVFKIKPKTSFKQGRSKSSAAELRRPNLSEGIKEEMEEVEKSRYEGPSKSRRGGKALRRIKTFLRREKKYVVVDQGGQSSQRSRTRLVSHLSLSRKIDFFTSL